MVKGVLILGGVLTFAVFLVTVIGGIESAASEGRIPMPGERALELSPGDYGVFYEEQVETGENEVFEPPPGIQIRVRGLGGAPDPELDLGGFRNQIATDDRTAEEIGTLRVTEEGRYGVLVGRPPRPAVGAAITVGESATASFLRAGKLAGLIAAATALLALAAYGFGRVRRPREAPPLVVAPPAPLSSSAAPPSSPAAAAPERAAQAPGSDLDGLERLGRLRDSGAISEEEFARLKAELLA